jgi:hypothetical protein
VLDPEEYIDVESSDEFFGPALTREDLHRALFECVMVLLRHEAGHLFTVDDKPIFDGHDDGDADGIRVFNLLIGDRVLARRVGESYRDYQDRCAESLCCLREQNETTNEGKTQ